MESALLIPPVVFIRHLLHNKAQTTRTENVQKIGLGKQCARKDNSSNNRKTKSEGLLKLLCVQDTAKVESAPWQKQCFGGRGWNKL
jgi:hypothetical protein